MTRRAADLARKPAGGYKLNLYLFGGRDSIRNLVCFDRTSYGVFKPPKLWVSGPNPTGVKHLNSTCYHSHFLPVFADNMLGS
jgi:hypothetical protein